MASHRPTYWSSAWVAYSKYFWNTQYPIFSIDWRECNGDENIRGWSNAKERLDELYLFLVRKQKIAGQIKLNELRKKGSLSVNIIADELKE